MRRGARGEEEEREGTRIDLTVILVYHTMLLHKTLQIGTKKKTYKLFTNAFCLKQIGKTKQ